MWPCATAGGTGRGVFDSAGSSCAAAALGLAAESCAKCAAVAAAAAAGEMKPAVAAGGTPEAAANCMAFGATDPGSSQRAIMGGDVLMTMPVTPAPVTWPAPSKALWPAVTPRYDAV